ncbi:hypothetical protein ATY81_25385 [Rhizobium sp. R72]|uniref:hypothetical protein n=1 Tax=unclassified Rhizobium TaxID=2613769 RepID=UPI000B534C90|nr:MULTISPECIES: hypothetical protein [unclassified Rhizobium]OWW00128.1 hypothetical protein ATY81_25385 [Rhizobium sp. R72]OWW00519.1 hypothetical protein ATY80_25385 [Rhizobium sp. R711]
MQLIETHVGTVTDGKLSVEFVGEGGELVSVRMIADDEGLDHDNAVRRAKEILVQLTAFGNEFDEATQSLRADLFDDPTLQGEASGERGKIA